MYHMEILYIKLEAMNALGFGLTPLIQGYVFLMYEKRIEVNIRWPEKK